MKYLFEGLDSYDTAPGTSVSRWFRLLGRCRWYFYWENFRIFIQSGLAARRGELDADHQVAYSSRNVPLIERCGGKVHIRNLDRLRALEHRPVVIAANHMSLLECGMLHSIVRPWLDFSFVVKKSLLKVPYFGDIIRALGVIPVTRKDPKSDLKTVLSEGKKILQSGRSLIVFPQSTRSETFDPEHFNTIAVKIARFAGVPVVPLALKTDLVANGKLLRDLGPIRPEREVWFDFGEPLEIIGNGSAQQEAIINFIAPRIEAWRRADSGVAR